MYAIDHLDVPPLRSAGGTVRLPGSKSISNRVLLLAALSVGYTDIADLLDSDDTRVMLAALAQLGCRIEPQADGALRVHGLGGALPVKQAQLFLGNAGTAMRPLTAALALLASVHGGAFELSGIARMHERPIGDLVDALRQLGCPVDCLGQEGYPPLRLGKGSAVRRIAFGGGSPNAISPTDFVRLVDALTLHMPLEDPSWSIELDPRTLTAGWGQAMQWVGTEKYQQHLVELRSFYRERRDAFQVALAHHFADLADWQVPQGGLFFWLTLKQPLDTRTLLAQALEQNVAFMPGEPFFSEPDQHLGSLRLNFSHIDPARLDEGLKRLAAVVRQAQHAQAA